MPPLNPVAGIARVAVQMTTQVGSALNIFHVGNSSNTAAWIVADLDLACAKLAAAYSAFAGTYMSNTITGFVVSAQDLTSVTGLEGSDTVTVTGGDTNTALPLNAAAVISWQAGRHYRGGHPRSYICGLTTNSIVNSHQITAAYSAALSSFAGSIISDLGGALWTRSGTVGLVAVHRTQHGAILATPLVDNITGSLIRPRVDSQRRRLGKE